MRRTFGAAALGRVGAARVEGAAGRRIERRGEFALQHDALALLAEIDTRRRGEQGLRVRVERALEDRLLRYLLGRPAEIHDEKIIGDVADDAEIVRDEEVGQAELVLQVVEQVEHLGLDRDVEGGDRLVGDHQLGPQHERARDGDALALAAREHVRVALVMLGPQPDLFHHVARRRRALRLARFRVDDERLLENGADLLARVERGIGVLEDDLNGAAQRATFGFRFAFGGIPAGDAQGAAARLLDQRDQAGKGRLATAGLADDAERLAGLQGEGDAVDRAQGRASGEDAAADIIAAGQVDALGDRDRRLCHGHGGGRAPRTSVPSGTAPAATSAFRVVAGSWYWERG